MSSPRKQLISAVTAWLRGLALPVGVEPETGDAELVPPYAVVRVSSETPLAPGQCDIAKCDVVVAVFSAEGTSAAQALDDASAVFDALDWPERDDLIAFCEGHDVVMSSWVPMETETEHQEGRWLHARRFETIAEHAPPAV